MHTMNRLSRKPLARQSASLATGCLLTLFSICPALPADAKPVDPPKSHWESVAAIDLALTRGNSRTFLGTASVNSTRKWPSDEILLGGSAGYGETTTTSKTGPNTTSKTADYLKGFGQYNHLFT